MKTLYYKGDKFDQNSQNMEKAVQTNDMDLLVFLYENGLIDKEEDDHEHVAKGAAYYGNFEMLKWLHKTMPDAFTSRVMESAVAGSQLKIMNWLLKNTKIIVDGTETMEIAVENQDLKLIKWVDRNTKASVDTSLLDEAISAGNLKIVKYFWHTRPKIFKPCIMESAVMKKNRKIIDWLYKNTKLGFTKEAFQAAVETGDFGLVRYHYKTQKTFTRGTIYFIRQNKNSEIGKWLSKRIDTDSYIEKFNRIDKKTKLK